MKPPIPYYGGKQRIASRVVALFPEHDHYVEPFAGGLSVLLAKPTSKVETINDLDQNVVTFWRVLRDRPTDLERVCRLTPHSRVELDLSRDIPSNMDELEVARRVWCQLATGRSGRRTRTGWRFYVDGGATSSGMDVYLHGYISRMLPAAERLARVQLECKPALDIIADYGQCETTLLYVDPPYLSSTRRSRQYVHELDTEAQHTELAEALQRARARVVLSGYHSALYDRLYTEWQQVEIPARTQSGPGASRTEVLWMNFSEPSLFNSDAATA